MPDSDPFKPGTPAHIKVGGIIIMVALLGVFAFPAAVIQHQYVYLGMGLGMMMVYPIWFIGRTIRSFKTNKNEVIDNA